MYPLWRVRISEWAVLLLLACTILWKGGKSLESTWLLAGTAALLTILYWLQRQYFRRDQEKLLEQKQGLSVVRKELPMGLWIVSLLYILWSVLSFAFSATSNYGLDEVFRTAGYILLFLWVARQQIEQENVTMIERFPRVLAGSAVIAALIGTMIYVLQPINRFVGTFFDIRFHTDYWPNAWAEFFLLAWPMLLLVAWRQSQEKHCWTLLAILGFLIATLWLSYSRGAMLALGGQCAILFVLFASVTVRDIRYRRAMMSIAKSVFVKLFFIIAVAALLFVGINELRSRYHDVQSVTEKVTFQAAEGRSSIDERSQFWKQALQLAKERPLTGWGPYSFRFVQPALMKHVLATSDHPHNVLLKFAMERGFPAAILFASVIGTVLGLSLFSFFVSRKSMSAEYDACTILCFISVTGVLLHNFIDYNLQFVGIGMPSVLLLGLLVHPATPVLSNPHLSFRHWKLRKFLSHLDVVIAVLVLGFLLWEGVFLCTSSLGRHAWAAGKNEEALEWFEFSHLALFSRDIYLSEAQIHMNQQHYAEAEIALSHYEARNAQDPRLWKMRGELFLLRGEYGNAVHALEEAYNRGRFTDLGIARLYIETLRRSGENTGMDTRKLELDELFSAYAEAIEQNTHFIALSHNVDELQTVARLLAQLYPVDANRYKAIARNALNHAKEEREKYQARPEGILW